MRLFLYGTLLDRPTLTRFAGRALPSTPATLAGWRRVRLRGTAYPTLIRARGRVAGVVVAVDAAALHRLTAYEGPRYTLRRLAVATARGNTAAFAWIAAAAMRRPWP